MSVHCMMVRFILILAECQRMIRVFMIPTVYNASPYPVYYNSAYRIDSIGEVYNDGITNVTISYGNIDSPRYNYAPADAFKIDGSGKLYSYVDYTGNSYGHCAALRGLVAAVRAACTRMATSTSASVRIGIPTVFISSPFYDELNNDVPSR